MCWDEGLDPRITRERYELFVYEDHFTSPSGAGGKEDHGRTFPYLIPIMDGGYGRKVVQYWSKWDEVMDKFEQNMHSKLLLHGAHLCHHHLLELLLMCRRRVLSVH